jgi:hypothetical protein
MEISSELLIKPFQGVNSIKFGMSPEEVANILGASDTVSENHLKQRIEFRSFANFAYSSEEPRILCHIGFGRQMSRVIFDNINFFEDDSNSVLRRLIIKDSAPMLYLGFLVFIKLGISLTGFHDQDISQKALSLFEEGAWDKRSSRMKEFHLSS